jgi:hypothetical protein
MLVALCACEKALRCHACKKRCMLLLVGDNIGAPMLLPAIIYP